ncbi:MAG: recombinase family protein [Clostridia bacterium]|nr:recombinase family protein [Clostridia bacterium]
MKAVIYARYSSDNQREESIEGQLRENKAFAEKNGIEIIGTYIDRALSAKTDNRPEFQKMIKDSSKGLFDIVIVWKLDRFARNRYDSAFYKATLKKNNVKVMSATENISEGADGILLEAILEGFAEYYSVELAEKIKRGMTENALKLRSNGVRAPIGYYIDDEKHFQIDENNAPIIIDIFTLYNDGKKVSEIVELMKSRGIKNRGNFMNYNAIFRILTNRKYIGEYKFGDILVPNAFPAIIDEGLFNAVQDRMKRNKKAPAMHRSEDDYLLTTHLFCGKCGAMMTGEIGTSHTETKYRYYKCNQAKKKKCDKKTVRKEWLENLVIDTILELITDDSVIEELAERVYRFQDVESAESILLKAQLEEVEKKLNNLAEAMAQGIFSATTKKLLDDLEAQKKTIETDIIQYQIRNPIVPKEQLLFALYNYRKLDMSVQSDRQKLIDSFVNSIYLYDDHFIITFNYKNTSKKVSLKEINSSSLTSSTPPNKRRLAVASLLLFGGTKCSENGM